MPSRIPTPTWQKLTDEELFRPLRAGPIDVDGGFENEAEGSVYSDFECVSMHESLAQTERDPIANTINSSSRYTDIGIANAKKKKKNNDKYQPILYPSPIQCWKLVRNAIARSSITSPFVDQLKDELSNAGYSRVSNAFQLKPGYSLDGKTK